MKNISLDTTSFSDQLGLYDFFNVLIYGSIFVCGLCAINSNLNSYMWSNLSFAKGLGIALLIYIVGMVLQELGSFIDRYCTNIYTGMHRSILKGYLDKDYKQKTSNKIIENPVVLEQYRKIAKKALKGYIKQDDKSFIENDYMNGYVFSVCQYYVSVYGKDKKIEKMRALFSMSKTLMSCFFLLATISLISLFTDVDMSINICNAIGICANGGEQCVDKILMMFACTGLGFAYYFRARRTMRNFLLILLGTYNALVCSENNKNKSLKAKYKIVKYKKERQ